MYFNNYKPSKETKKVMKKVLLTLAVIGTICLSACEKDQLTTPEKQTLKADKGILCRDCGGGWDITATETATATTLRVAVPTDTIPSAAPAKPVKEKK